MNLTKFYVSNSDYLKMTGQMELELSNEITKPFLESELCYSSPNMFLYEFLLTDEQIENALATSDIVTQETDTKLFYVSKLEDMNLEFILYQLPATFGPFKLERNLLRLNVKSFTKMCKENGTYHSYATYWLFDTSGRAIATITLLFNGLSKELTIDINIINNDEPNENVLKDLDDPYLTLDNVHIAFEYVKDIIENRKELWQ